MMLMKSVIIMKIKNLSYDEEEDDYTSKDDNTLEDLHASYLEDENEDEIVELQNEAIVHNLEIQLRRSTRIYSKNATNRMSWK